MPLSDKVCAVVEVGRRSADKRDVMGKTRALCEDVCENPLKAGGGGEAVLHIFRLEIRVQTP